MFFINTVIKILLPALRFACYVYCSKKVTFIVSWGSEFVPSVFYWRAFYSNLHHGEVSFDQLFSSCVSHNKKVCKGDWFLFPSLPSPTPHPPIRPFHRVTQLTDKHLFSLVEISTVRVKCCLITQGNTPKLSIGSKARSLFCPTHV